MYANSFLMVCSIKAPTLPNIMEKIDEAHITTLHVGFNESKTQHKILQKVLKIAIFIGIIKYAKTGFEHP